MRLLSTPRHKIRDLVAAVFIAFPLLATPLVSYAETNVDSTGREVGSGSERNVEFTQGELDQMLAPVALYPDTVLSQVLIASTYPIEIVQADRWASSHKNLKGEEAVRLVDDKDWDPSVKALVAFPDILERMSDDIDWTQRLGDAFLSDEDRVMDTVQNLRKKAYSSGSLSKVQHLKVERDDEQIIIEPAEERVVYVPVYDTRVVYGNWWWPDYPPVYWHYPSSYVYTSGFYWGPRIYIGPTFFYSSCHLHERRVVVVDRHYYRSAPHFYTSRSIVRYEGAREWRHNPVHRRGVAYYNDNLRGTYGSRHESYRSARVYRENHRESYTPTQRSDGSHRNDRLNRDNDGVKSHPRVVQAPNTDRGVNRNGDNRNVDRSNDRVITRGADGQPYDRAEQLRNRMNGQHDNRIVTPRQQDNGSRQQIDRTLNRADNGVENRAESRVDNRPQRAEDGLTRQPYVERRIERENRQQIDRGFTRATAPETRSTDVNAAEHEERAARFNRQPEVERAPASVNPTIERAPERSQNIERVSPRNDVNNRATRVDDNNARRMPESRPSRAERTDDGGNRGVRGRDTERQ